MYEVSIELLKGTSNEAYVGEEEYRIQGIDEEPGEVQTEMTRAEPVEPDNGRASVRTTEEDKQEPWDRATKSLDENKAKISSALPHHLRICIKRSFQVIFFLFALIFSIANTVSKTSHCQLGSLKFCDLQISGLFVSFRLRFQ